MTIEITTMEGLSERQQEAIPKLKRANWHKLTDDPALSLRTAKHIFEDEVTVILGETRTPTPWTSPQNVHHPAPTSDAVGIMELIGNVKRKGEIHATVDQWHDAKDLAVKTNIILVGSGIVNTYAYAVNDIMALRFDRSKTTNMIIDTIIGKDGRPRFGGHGNPVDGSHCGLVLICKNPFNLSKKMLWIAGITGMSTKAAATCARNLIQSPTSVLQNHPCAGTAVACVVVPRPPAGKSLAECHGRYTIREAGVVWLVNPDGSGCPFQDQCPA